MFSQKYFVCIRKIRLLSLFVFPKFLFETTDKSERKTEKGQLLSKFFFEKLKNGFLDHNIRNIIFNYKDRVVMINRGDHVKVKQAYIKTWPLLGKQFSSKFLSWSYRLFCKKNWIPTSFRFCVIGLQIYR